MFAFPSMLVGAAEGGWAGSTGSNKTSLRESRRTRDDTR